MENNKNFNEMKKLVKSLEQAKMVLKMLLHDSEKLNLEMGISGLIDTLKNPELDILLDRFPELLQEYELKELLSGNLKINDAKVEDVKTAGLLWCLNLLIHLCNEISEDSNPTDHHFDPLRYILNSISYYQFVYELLIIIVSVVGEDYYETFKEKVADLNLDVANTTLLKNDPGLREHIELMAWFGLVRVFLESTYMYFDISD